MLALTDFRSSGMKKREGRHGFYATPQRGIQRWKEHKEAHIPHTSNSSTPCVAAIPQISRQPRLRQRHSPLWTTYPSATRSLVRLATRTKTWSWNLEITEKDQPRDPPGPPQPKSRPVPAKTTLEKVMLLTSTERDIFGQLLSTPPGVFDLGPGSIVTASAFQAKR